VIDQPLQRGPGLRRIELVGEQLAGEGVQQVVLPVPAEFRALQQVGVDELFQQQLGVGLGLAGRTAAAAVARSCPGQCPSSANSRAAGADSRS
jgi:hypothetical protein